MIWDSAIWKKGLQKELGSFSKLIINTETFKVEYFNFVAERFFFVSAFIIRKLSEGNKLSDELTSKGLNCIRYRRKNDKGVIDFLNCYDIERFYDLDKKDRHILKLKDTCNSLIHSFVFSTVVDSGQLTGIFVNSERTKDKCLYYIELNTFIGLINDVINDEIVSMCYDRVTGKLKKSGARSSGSNLIDRSG